MGSILAIIALTMAAVLTLPSLRAQLSAEFDPSQPVPVALTVCHAKADVGAAKFDECMHRALPNAPAFSSYMPAATP